MGACPRIESERLILRPFVEADVEAYTQILREPAVRPGLHLPEDVGRDEAWEQLAAFLGQWELRGTGQWALEERTSGRFVGRAGLHNPEREGWPGVEVGWALHPDAWGRGYATEAGRVAIDYAFDVLGLDEVVSLILPDNERSQAVARRLGLTRGAPILIPHLGPDLPIEVWRLRRSAWVSTRSNDAR